MKRNKIFSGIVIATVMAFAATGCGESSASDGGDTIKVGFAQTGSESGWRSANTESMKAAFSEENGFELVFNAADNDPAAQIAAVRSFISQGVDAIVVAPIVEDGWDDVFQEAQDADIPIILEDRTVSASEDLYATWVGLDFKQEGVTAGEWAAENFGDQPTKMVVLEGTTGSAPANDRAEGFSEAIAGTQIETIDSQTGDFTRDGGKTVMEGFIQKYGIDGIDLLYAHNDDMALGAMQVLDESDRNDVLVFGVDGLMEAVEAIANGDQYVATAFNDPMALGAATIDTAVKLVEGEDVPDYVDAGTGLISDENAESLLGDTLFARQP